MLLLSEDALRNERILKEWTDHLNKNEQQAIVLFSLNKDGMVSIVHLNEVTREHLIDMCERTIAKYKQK